MAHGPARGSAGGGKGYKKAPHWLNQAWPLLRNGFEMKCITCIMIQVSERLVYAALQKGTIRTQYNEKGEQYHELWTLRP